MSLLFRLRRVAKKVLDILFSPTTAIRKISNFVLGLRQKKRPQQFFSLAAKNVVRSKSRVALRATSLAAAVAQNGYFDPNVAPAQQRNS